MYNETIKAENKIISTDDLNEIFQLMGNTLKKYLRIYEQEEIKNRTLDYSHQNYSFKDTGSKMKVTVDFYDNTTITFDNYDSFMAIFYSRVDEIKSLNIYYSLSYSIIESEQNRRRDNYHQVINMYINENKFEINLNLNSNDPKLNDMYVFIKNKILNAPEKYDDTIKKKNKITNIVGLSSGLIPSMIIVGLLLLVPIINKFILKGYVVYPLGVLFIAYTIGNVIASIKLEKYYINIMPEKKFAGYDTNNKKSIYEDDVEKFVGTSEILIGKKVNNLDCRRMIQKEYSKSKSFLPKLLLVLLIISIIIIVIGLFV